MTTPEQANLNAFLGRIGSNTLTAADQAVLSSALTTVIANWPNFGFGPDALGRAGDQSTNEAEWLAPLFAIAFGAGGGGGGGVPPSWLVPAWFIDPVAGNDANNGQSALTPIKTWAQLINLWGTRSPILRQNTVITFLSSQPDNTDPVIWTPYIGNGATVSIQGTATVVTAGVVLAGVVAKNRATPQLLNATLGATAALDQMVVNTTAGKSSRAFVYKLVAGTTFSLSQPLVPAAIPAASIFPAELDTWANGDTVNLVTLSRVNICQVAPVMLDLNGGSSNLAYLYNLTIFDPAGVGLDAVYLGQNVRVVECLSQRNITWIGNNGDLQNEALLNVDNLGQLDGGKGGPSTIGVVAGITRAAISSDGPGLFFDGDTILNVSGPDLLIAGAFLSLVFLDSTGSGVIPSGQTTVFTGGYGAAKIWGPGVFGPQGPGRVNYPAGAGAAVATFLNTGGLQINGQANAHSVISGAPDVLNGGISITPAHLDAAAGAAGFGGTAFIPGGASISNLS